MWDMVLGAGSLPSRTLGRFVNARQERTVSPAVALTWLCPVSPTQGHLPLSPSALELLQMIFLAEMEWVTLCLLVSAVIL